MKKNELKKFKLIFEFFENVIRRKKFRIVNRFLMVLDLQRIKFLEFNKLDLVKSKIKLIGLLFKILINDNQFDVAENFLKWTLETEEEIENFKSTFSCEEFV